MSRQDSFLEIDTERQMEAIIQKLTRLPDRIAAPNILKNAINDTTLQVRRMLNKRAKKRYALTDTSILKDKSLGAPQVEKASTSDLTATLLSKGPMLDLMKFMTQPNTGTAAAAARVINESSAKSLQMGNLKAFVTTFASGHTAIVQRHPSDEYSSSGKEKRLTAHRAKGRTWPPDMTKLKKLLGPAVPHMMGVSFRMSQNEIDAMVYSMLQKHIDKRIAKAMAGK